jgi:hypothetical protein
MVSASGVYSTVTTPRDFRINYSPSFTNYHDFTGLPLTEDGWTDIESLVQSDSRVIYVSTSGDNATGRYNSPSDAALTGSYSVLEPNESAISPYQTLAAGYAQLRTGYPDFLLLKRGNSWASEGLNDWRKSGRSQTERMVFGAYGSESIDRPSVGTQTAFRGAENNYLVIASIQFATDETSINWESGGNHILLEDVESPPTLDGAGKNGIKLQNINGDGGLDYLAIRRSVVAGRWREQGQVGYNQGMFIDDSEKLLIEECIFDQNGWAADGVDSSEDIKAHNTYITLGRTGRENHIWRGNISTRGRAVGIQAGSGGEVTANLSVQDGIGIVLGKMDNYRPQGVGGTAKHNVILHGRDVNANDKRGWGFSLDNINGAVLEDNIIAGNTGSGMPYGFRLEANLRLGIQLYVRDVTIRDNIVHEWNGNGAAAYGIALYADEYAEGVEYNYGSDREDFLKDITITNNSITLSNTNARVITAGYISNIIDSEGNMFYSARDAASWFGIEDSNYSLDGYKALYSDTTTTSNQPSPSGAYGVTDYLASIGDTATLEAFYAKIRQQRRGDWDTRYTAIPIINFVRDKFGRPPVSLTY